MTEQQKKETRKYEKYAVFGGATIAFQKENKLPYPYHLETGTIDEMEKELYIKTMLGKKVWYRDDRDAEQYGIKAVHFSTPKHPNTLVFDLIRKVSKTVYVEHTDIPFSLVFATRELCLSDWNERQSEVYQTSKFKLFLMQDPAFVKKMMELTLGRKPTEADLQEVPASNLG